MVAVGPDSSLAASLWGWEPLPVTFQRLGQLHGVGVSCCQNTPPWLPRVSASWPQAPQLVPCYFECTRAAVALKLWRLPRLISRRVCVRPKKWDLRFFGLGFGVFVCLFVFVLNCSGQLLLIANTAHNVGVQASPGLHTLMTAPGGRQVPQRALVVVGTCWTAAFGWLVAQIESSVL